MTPMNPEEALIWGLIQTVGEDLGEEEFDVKKIERLTSLPLEPEPQAVQSTPQPSTKRKKTFSLWGW